VSAPGRVMMVILAHDRAGLAELVRNVRVFCPDAALVLYNSGPDPSLGEELELEHFPAPRRQEYARVCGFFLDVAEWLAGSGREYEYWVNLETDLLFIRPGYEAFLDRAMEGWDYMCPHLRRFTPRTSRWRPIRSLRPELPRWHGVMGAEYTHAGFSPAQVFRRSYADVLAQPELLGEIRRLLAQNRSFSLQEILYPTLADRLGLRARDYPEQLRPINRYRPYQAVRGVERALATDDAYFVHPVRRAPADPARRRVEALEEAALPALAGGA
jgi:hypothetical protein